MKILFLSTYDKEGGATAWFVNLAQTLYCAGHDVEMVVKYKNTNVSFVQQILSTQKKNRKQRLSNLIFKKNSKRDIFFESKPEYAFFPKETEMSEVAPVELIEKSCRFVPDIVISGLIYELANTTTLRQLHELWNVPVYMTAFDANVYTGGCHVLWECEKFYSNCTDCPAVKNVQRRPEVEKSFLMKKANIKSANIGIMYASPWSLHNATLSACFRDAPKFDIGMCIDTELYTNKNRDIAKRVFEIPLEAKVVFAGSADIRDKRKGVDYFFDSLNILWEELDVAERDKIYLLVAGRNVSKLEDVMKGLHRFHYKCIDFISDNRLLSLAYQASDIFVCPSVDDAGPMMVAEALACGTPVIGFPVGLMFNQFCVQNGKTGYVVEMKSSRAMAQALKTILELDPLRYAEMSKACRDIALQELSQKRFVDNFNDLAQCLGK